MPYVRYLGVLPPGVPPTGALLVIESPGYAEPPGRLLLRDGESFATLAELAGVNGPAALSPGGRTLLAAGPLVGGEHASCVLIDVATWRITRALPLMRPFAWVDERRFVAQRPEPGGGLVLMDLDIDAARPLLGGLPLDPECAVVLSEARDRLYTATGYSRISAVRLEDGALLWQRPPVRVVHQGMTYALALDLPRGRLVAAGLGDHDLLELDAETGRELQREDLGKLVRAQGLPVHNALGCALARPDGGLILGSDKGVLLERGPEGGWEARKVAGRAIDALALLPDGARLVLGGAERNLRLTL